MSYQSLELSVEDGLAVLRLNRPEVLNSLNETILQELLHAGRAIATDDSVRAVLLTGNGRGFCAGADLGAMDTDRSSSACIDRGNNVAEQMETLFNPVVELFANMSKPVIAAVNGIAAGGGMGLALSADMVIAAESASFMQVFIPQLGIIPDMGSTWFLPRLIGEARAMGMALSGERVDAKTAEDWGMIWRAVPDEQLMEEATRMGRRFASGATYGIAMSKKALRASLHNDLSAQLDLEKESQRLCCSTEDFAEGVEAFSQKRRPQFNGKVSKQLG
jgi:2-(1,2-epoxy-1,2-dihydrophenyl)acetyl-CoA isomerase